MIITIWKELYMTEIENSKRVLLQATYTPFIHLNEKTSGNAKLFPKRPFEKYNFAKDIAPTPEEVAYVRNNHEELSNHTNVDNGLSHKEDLKALKAIESVIPELGSPNALRNVASFAEVNADALVSVTKGIINFRQSQVHSAVKALNSIFEAYKENFRDYHQRRRLKWGLQLD